MAPKKKCNNAFAYFMHDVRREVGNISLAEAAKRAGPMWEKMSEQQKAPYKMLAQLNRNGGGDAGDKYTTAGRRLRDVQMEQDEERDKRQFMVKTIADIVERNVINNTLKNQDFYIVDVNIFCKTSDGTYYPAEFAVSKFNLEEGVHDTFHTHIKHAKLPLGYAGEAKSIANEPYIGHQLPLPPEALGESDAAVIVAQLSQFLLKSCNPLTYLYTIPKKVTDVESVLNQLLEGSGMGGIDIPIFDLSELFKNLMNATTPNKSECSALAQVELEKDVYDFYDGLGCEYHEQTDVIQNCSLSRVKRWGFIMADFCCKYMDIPLIPGQHIPQQAASSRNELFSRSVSRADSDWSMRSLSRNSVASTTGPSDWNVPNQRKNNRFNNYRPASPTESYTSNVSSYQCNSRYQATPNDFDRDTRQYDSNQFMSVDENRGATALPAQSSSGFGNLRRPHTTSYVGHVGHQSAAAGSLLEYSTVESTDCDEFQQRPTMRIGGGRGRKLAARFYNQ